MNEGRNRRNGRARHRGTGSRGSSAPNSEFAAALGSAQASDLAAVAAAAARSASPLAGRRSAAGTRSSRTRGDYHDGGRSLPFGPNAPRDRNSASVNRCGHQKKNRGRHRTSRTHSPAFESHDHSRARPAQSLHEPHAHDGGDRTRPATRCLVSARPKQRWPFSSGRCCPDSGAEQPDAAEEEEEERTSGGRVLSFSSCVRVRVRVLVLLLRCSPVRACVFVCVSLLGRRTFCAIDWYSCVYAGVRVRFGSVGW